MSLRQQRLLACTGNGRIFRRNAVLLLGGANDRAWPRADRRTAVRRLGLLLAEKVLRVVGVQGLSKLGLNEAF